MKLRYLFVFMATLMLSAATPLRVFAENDRLAAINGGDLSALEGSLSPRGAQRSSIEMASVHLEARTKGTR